jgi:hypothetical protein
MLSLLEIARKPIMSCVVDRYFPLWLFPALVLGKEDEQEAVP